MLRVTTKCVLLTLDTFIFWNWNTWRECINRLFRTQQISRHNLIQTKNVRSTSFIPTMWYEASTGSIIPIFVLSSFNRYRIHLSELYSGIFASNSKEKTSWIRLNPVIGSNNTLMYADKPVFHFQHVRSQNNQTGWQPYTLESLVFWKSRWSSFCLYNSKPMRSENFKK